MYTMNDASKLPIEPEQLPSELCPFGLSGAERRALDIVAEARRVHQSTLEDDNELWNCLSVSVFVSFGVLANCRSMAVATRAAWSGSLICATYHPT